MSKLFGEFKSEPMDLEEALKRTIKLLKEKKPSQQYPPPTFVTPEEWHYLQEHPVCPTCGGKWIGNGGYVVYCPDCLRTVAGSLPDISDESL